MMYVWCSSINIAVPVLLPLYFYLIVCAHISKLDNGCVCLYLLSICDHWLRWWHGALVPGTLLLSPLSCDTLVPHSDQETRPQSK